MAFRPASVTVFGALNIVFGLFGLLGLAFNIAMLVAAANSGPNPVGFNTSPTADLYNRVAVGVYAVSTSMLLVSGFGLLSMRGWGRKLALAYAILAVVSTIANTALTYVLIHRPLLEHLAERHGSEQTGLMVGLFVGMAVNVLWLIYPGLLWFFMTRPLVVAAFNGVSAPFEDDWSVNPTSPANLTGGDTSNPYLSPMTDSAPTMRAGDSVVETFVPSKNGPALASYYLGLFSLFPCVGFFLAVPAVYYGVKGLRLVRDKPEVRGGVHAWVGVVCGSLFGLFNLVLLIGTAGVAVASVMKQ